MQSPLFDPEQNPFDGQKLPDQSRVPLNLGERTVHSVVDRDLCNEWGSLIVTGYSGLEQLIQLITGRGVGRTPMRIILGSDPVTVENPKINLRRYDFSEEMREYWLKRGISLSLSMTRLRDLEPSLRSTPIDLDVILKKLQGVDLRRRWEERIVACILGYGQNAIG